MMNAHSALVPVPWSLLFVAKIERRGRGDRDERVFFPASNDRGFAAQFSPQTTRKKPSGTQGIVPASITVQCVKRKTHLSKYYKETCACNFSCSYSICTKHPHGKNLGDRVGWTCLENFACLWKYPATRLFSSTRKNHQPNFGFRLLCENRMT